ncbi:MAG: hypothetical protein ACK4ZN_07700 [Oceanibaculum sp.]
MKFSPNDLIFLRKRTSGLLHSFDAAIIKSVDGSTYRALDGGIYRPSSIFRTWARYFVKFEFFYFNFNLYSPSVSIFYACRIQRYWKRVSGVHLPFGLAVKLFDLLMKALCDVYFINNNIRKKIISKINCPVDSKVMDFLEKKGHNISVELKKMNRFHYKKIQLIIRNYTKPYPSVYLDCLIFDMIKIKQYNIEIKQKKKTKTKK